jgi:hypothetical protein
VGNQHLLAQGLSNMCARILLNEILQF